MRPHPIRLAARSIALAGVAALTALAAPARALPAHPCLAPAADCTLREIASAAGVRVGAAAASGFLAEVPYAQTLAAEFNSITAENHMKWPQIHPAEGVWSFEAADALADFAVANDMTMRGHTLLWANPARIPDWVNASPDAETLEGWLDDHIRTVVGRYADVVDSWDVINEPLQNLGTTLYENVFFQQLGEGYIAEAFRIAHEADPDAQLFLNEVLVMEPHVRFEAFYELVADLVASGVPIHGVGLQGHVIAGLLEPSAEGLAAVVGRFADLGLAVEITEFDVVMGNGSEMALARQAGIYGELLSACLEIVACQGITFWGFTDAHTWIDGTFGPGHAPLPFDEGYGRKPAYHAARDALTARLPEPGGLALAASLALALGTCARRRP